MSLLVLKFGGSSVGNCGKIINVAKLIKKHYVRKNKIIVISSAMGGVTNELIEKSKKFNSFYQFYFKHILPKIGIIISRSDGYKYLPESVQYFPSRSKVCDMISSAGFINQEFNDLTLGICSIFTGYKKH